MFVVALGCGYYVLNLHYMLLRYVLCVVLVGTFCTLSSPRVIILLVDMIGITTDPNVLNYSPTGKGNKIANKRLFLVSFLLRKPRWGSTKH